jgi:hypothetical protein
VLALAVSPHRFAIRRILVYDMYPWDDRPASPAGSASPAHAAPARTAPAPRAADGARAALQVALDRRDNGGDAAAAHDAAAAADTAAVAGPVAAAHRPTAGPTRQ